jgi:hypothetical protein
MVAPAYEISEYAGSPKFSGSRLELSATRRVTLNWTDIDAHFNSLFPGAVLGIPAFPTFFPGSLLMFAESVEYEPVCGDEDAIVQTPPLPNPTYPNQYALAKATIQYKTYPWQMSPSGNNIVTSRIALSTEVMTLPNLGLVWASSGEAINTNDVTAGKTIGMIQWHVMLHGATNPAFGAMVNNLGLVNDSAFGGFPTGTLLFTGADASQQVAPDGSTPWDVDLVFTSRMIDGNTAQNWNYFFHSLTGKYEKIQIKNNGSPQDLFQTADFTTLY